MDRLLKHFGLGSSKKSPAHQHYHQNAESTQDLDTKGTRSSDCLGAEGIVTDGRDYDNRRPNSEYARTLPASGESRSANLSREHNWSLHRGRVTKQSVLSASSKEKESSVKNLQDADEKGTVQTASKENSNQTTRAKAFSAIPLSDDYSDPYDLKARLNSATTPVQEPDETKVVMPADPHEGDYSVPYDLTSRPKETDVKKSDKQSVPEKSLSEEKPVVPEKVPVMYDDPYEESPMIPISLSSSSVPRNQHQGMQHQQQQQAMHQQHQQQQMMQPQVMRQQHQQPVMQQQHQQQQAVQQQHQQLLQRQQQVMQQHQQPWLHTSEKESTSSLCQKLTREQNCGLPEDFSRKCVLSKENVEGQKKTDPPAIGDSSANVKNSVPIAPSKVYQLSAEYGGFAEKEDDDSVGNYTELQEVCSMLERPANPPDASSRAAAVLPPVARHARPPLPPGMSDEPWDLRLSQRGVEDRPFSAQSLDLTKKLPPVDAMSMSSVSVVNAGPRNGLMSRSCHVEMTAEKTHEGKDSSFPVYGVPWSTKSKNGKHVESMSASRSQRATGGSSGRSANRVSIPVPVRSSSLKPGVDSRPLEDYDNPWDQKKAVCKTVSDTSGRPVSDTNARSASLTGANSSKQVANSVSSSWTSTLAEQIDTKLPLDKQPWYHGGISRIEAENLLRIHREGSYLVRNSESNKKDYSLSVRSARGFMHMKIVANGDGCFVLGQFSQPFCNIALMIVHYTIHKLPIKGAEHISLISPVGRKMA